MAWRLFCIICGMEYICVHGSTPEKLTEAVNQRITEGFKPLGGVAVSTTEAVIPTSGGHSITNTRWIVQAMIKE